MEREDDGRAEQTTMIIVDSKSVQNADTGGVKGYDAGKKSGIKWHVAVDVLGLPHAIMLTTADVTDRAGAIDMVRYYHGETDDLNSVQKVLVDSAYTGDKFARAIKEELPNAEVEVVKRNELHTFAVLPKRWIVERSFGWLDKCRRLWKNCERLLQNSFQMVTLAFIRLLLKRY